MVADNNRRFFGLMYRGLKSTPTDTISIYSCDIAQGPSWHAPGQARRHGGGTV